MRSSLANCVHSSHEIVVHKHGSARSRDWTESVSPLKVTNSPIPFK